VTTAPDGTREIYLALGCFWGAEELYWELPGVVATDVGYMGGTSESPGYRAVCTGMTGHAETVRVAYDPAVIDEYGILKAFWENHDPTQGNRQGNDVGSQYRSAIFWTTDAQRIAAERTRDAYGPVIAAAGYPAITTEILPAADHHYWLAEREHQKYLAVNPHGYRCHAKTGMELPALDTQ